MNTFHTLVHAAFGIFFQKILKKTQTNSNENTLNGSADIVPWENFDQMKNKP